MNDTPSTNRRGRGMARLAVVLCLLLVVGIVPMAAYGAPAFVRGTWSNASVAYLNSASISLFTTGTPTATYYCLDSGAETAGKSITTSVYGTHSLSFWSVGGPGTEGTTTMSFFVDEDVAPTLECNALATYPLSASITCTATDNFNGSGVDALYYRVDGGAYVTVQSSAAAVANKIFYGGLKTAFLMPAAIPPVTPTTPDAHNGANGTDCSMCHQIIAGGGDTGGGDTGGSTVASTIKKTVTVTGLGTHKVEFWAQDVARNVSTHLTKTFVITKASTTLTFARSASSVSRYHYVTLSGVLGGGVPAGAPIVIKVKSPGSSKYKVLKTVYTLADGSYKLRQKLSTHGRYYFKASYAGNASYLGAVPAASYLSVYCK